MGYSPESHRVGHNWGDLAHRYTPLDRSTHIHAPCTALESRSVQNPSDAGKRTGCRVCVLSTPPPAKQPCYLFTHSLLVRISLTKAFARSSIWKMTMRKMESKKKGRKRGRRRGRNGEEEEKVITTTPADRRRPMWKPSGQRHLRLGLSKSSFSGLIDKGYSVRLLLPLCSLQFSLSVVSDSLWPRGLQHTRPPCPSPMPRVYSNSCPLSWWCHSTISFSVVPFSSHLQSFSA